MNMNIVCAQTAIVSRSIVRSSLALNRPAAVLSSVGVWRQGFSTSSNAKNIPKSTFDDVTFESLAATDDQLKSFKDSHYRRPASDATIAKTKAALEKRGFKVHVVKDKADAFEKVKSLIPAVGVIVQLISGMRIKKVPSC